MLAVVDGAFSGFRAFAGRDGRINKRPSKFAAARFGAMASVVPLAILAVVLVAMIVGDIATYSELVTAGRRMLLVYLAFAGLIALGFLAYFARITDLQGLGTVLVLGPGTLFRPFLILGGAIAAGSGAAGAVKAVALLAALLMIGLEYPLNRHFARRLANHPFDS